MCYSIAIKPTVYIETSIVSYLTARASRDLAELYFAAIDMPEKARADAYHLALAVWHGMDYLVTWNCTHIASGKVKSIVQRINADRGIGSPIICTPEELMEA